MVVVAEELEAMENLAEESVETDEVAVKGNMVVVAEEPEAMENLAE